MRSARLIPVLCLSAALVGGCVGAAASWTYAPAPSEAPAASGVASGGPSAAPASTDPNQVLIAALGVKFEQAAVTAPAGKPFKIQFENRDPGTPHNVAIHKDSPTGEEIFKGEVFPGVATKTYDVPALPAGQYGFICTVHPTMTGTLTAQ